MSQGWIAIHRKFKKWEWYTSSNHVYLFVHLLLSANRSDGSWRGHKYKRGDVLTSLSKLEDETGLSKQNIRTILKNFKKTGEINTQPNTKLTHLSICNYDTYQSKSTEPNTELTQSQHGANTELTTNNNNNNNNNTNNYTMPDDIYSQMCEWFYNSLKDAGKVKKSQNWRAKNWHDGFRLLVEVDKINFEEFRETIMHYVENIDKQYAPHAFSPVSFREKWIQIKNFKDRLVSEQQPSSDDFYSGVRV